MNMIFLYICYLDTSIWKEINVNPLLPSLSGSMTHMVSETQYQISGKFTFLVKGEIFLWFMAKLD